MLYLIIDSYEETMEKREITAELARFIERTQIADMGEPVVRAAKELVTDFLGVTAAGSVAEPARIIQKLTKEQSSQGTATIIGTGLKSHPAWASFANGISGHALDFDDASQVMYGHPTVAVLPACMAVGELLNVSGLSLLESYIIGVEVTVKLAHGMNPAHYEWGWHSTCTLGSVGSAAAAAKLLGLKKEALRTALALAASQAAGLQQNFGTMTKPFHAGRASENGVLAALLAREGWTGDQNILEAPLGFFNLFCGPGNYEAEKVIDRLGKPFDIESPGIILKKFPSCAFSHPVIDAALSITQDPKYDAGKVDRVEGYIHELADQILIHREVKTGLEAKFSMEACLALALVDRNVSMKSFTDEKVRSKEVKDMMARIERKILPKTEKGPIEFGPATVRAFLKGGTVLEASVAKARGNPENPMSLQEIQAKYRECCSEVLPDQSTEQSLTLLENLENLENIHRLMDCFRID
jgi:2-methylcitrate dehydratase PrpD